jgi:small subunit ribosomal protein S16
MLVIRLSRTGKKNAPSYRLVAADKKRAVKGKYQEILGYYNPISKPKVFQADKEKIEAYLKQGAQLSVTALNLLCDHDYLPKSMKIKVVHAKKKEVAEEAAKPVAAKVETPAETVKAEDAVEDEPATEEVASEEPVTETVPDETSTEAPAETTEEPTDKTEE